MKILHFLGSFLNGGIETLLINVVNRQVAQGHEVAIMVGTKWDAKMLELVDRKIQLFLINKPVGSRNPWFMLKIEYLYHSYKPDILHLHSPGLEKLFLFKPFKEKRFVTIHNETIPIPFSSTVDQYIAISQCVKESFVHKTGHENCVICYNGIDVDAFLQKQSYSNKPCKLLVLGRVLFRVKAQDLIVKAFSNVKQEIRKQMTLDIWGDGQDFHTLTDIVKSLRLEQQIRLVGNVSNTYVAKHLCEYDMIICASHHEGLGISAIEAMAAGVPVLLSDALGFVEVTENGKYGTHFTHSDAKAMADALENAYNEYEIMCETAKKALAYSKRKFSISNYVNHLNQIYQI